MAVNESMGTSARILVVDDQQINREVLALPLQEWLIDDILDVYKAESGRMELVYTVVDLQAIGASGFEVSDHLRKAVEIPNIQTERGTGYRFMRSI